MAFEGEIVVALRCDGGRVLALDVASSRPDVGTAVLRGRRSDEVIALVERLHAVCGRSQGIAARLACAAAAGDEPTPESLASHAAAVADEALAETARSVLLHWPAWRGEAPAAAAIAAARAAAGADPQARRSDIATAVFGVGADTWLTATATPAQLAAWANAGATAAARHVGDALASRPSSPADGRPRPVALIDLGIDRTTMARLAAAIDADPAFARRARWRNAPAETGALARRQRDPLIATLLAGGCSRAAVRDVARLRELAGALAGAATPPAIGAVALGGGAGGIAWVENARGLLVHRVRLASDGRTEDVRIVAPTDWNFHPQGALAAAVVDVEAADTAAARRLVEAEVRSLDPCVGWRIETAEATHA